MVFIETQKGKVPKMSKAKISAKLQTQVKSRDNFTCRACGFGGDADFADYIVCDHSHSERNGGATTLANLQCLCIGCNLSKGSKNWIFPVRKKAVAKKVWAENKRDIRRFFSTGDVAFLKYIK